MRTLPEKMPDVIFARHALSEVMPRFNCDIFSDERHLVYNNEVEMEAEYAKHDSTATRLI
jgi:hypothetical protein